MNTVKIVGLVVVGIVLGVVGMLGWKHRRAVKRQYKAVCRTGSKAIKSQVRGLKAAHKAYDKAV